MTDKRTFKITAELINADGSVAASQQTIYNDLDPAAVLFVEKHLVVDAFKNINDAAMQALASTEAVMAA